MPRRNRHQMSDAEDFSQSPPLRRRNESKNPQQSLVQSAGPLDALPVEWVMQILRLLPIKHVFVLMSVNKKWEAAARQVVREKTRLRIGHQRNGPVSLVSELDAIDRVAPQHWEGMWKSLLQMDSLQVYECMDELCSELDLITDYWSLAVRNAQTLQLLVVPYDFPEQTEDGHEVVFPKLKSLSCRRLTVAAAAACPQLRKIRLFSEQDLEALNQLNMKKMQDFELLCVRLDATNVQRIVAMISQMINLTRLHLFFNGIREDDDDNAVFFPVLRIFDSSHLLEDVSIFLIDSPDIQLMEETIETLVRRNPGLKKVELLWGEVSNNVLVAFSRLNHLEELRLRGSGSALSLTVAGVQSLLRGGSRAVLRSFALGCIGEEWDLTDLRQEVHQIQTETGKPFLKAVIGYWSLMPTE